MKKLFVLLLSMTFIALTCLGAEKNPLRKKLKAIMIKHIQYEDVAIDVVVTDLKKRVLKLDPDAKGINIILALAKGKKPENYKVNLIMDNIPLEAALDYITRSADLQFFLKDNTVVVAGKELAREEMETRTYRAKPHAVSSLQKIYKEVNITEKKGAAAKDDKAFEKLNDEEVFK